MKFTTFANVTFHQVLADAEIKASFFGPNGRTDALTLAAKIVEDTGSTAVVYSYTHESINVSP